MPVVHSAKAVGLWFEEFTGAVSVDWEEIKTRIVQRLSKIARCKLSAFGRAFAVNAYALSTFLYHAEFTDVDAAFLLTLQPLIAAVVDREESPPGHGFAGIAAANLVGHPKNGGIGLMPLEEHMKARVAKWAMKLVTDDVDHPSPWIRVARALMRIASRGINLPVDQRLLLLSPPREISDTYFSRFPPLVQRLLDAVRALPPAEVLNLQEAWQPGPWCHVMPLWANPMLQCEGKGGLEFSETGCFLRQCQWQTLGELLKARDQIAQWTSTQWAQLGRHFATYDGFYSLGSQQHEAVQHIDAFLLELPPGWLVAAGSAEAASSVVPLPNQQEVVTSLIKSVGWRHGTKTFTPDTLTVKAATELLTTPPNTQLPRPQSAKIQAFVAIAGGEFTEDLVLKVLKRLWKLPVENYQKEVVWRLVLDGLPTIARLHSQSTCPCGTAQGPDAGREHVYFECAAIQPILHSIMIQLQGEWELPPQQQPIQKHHVWLAVRPTAALHQGIWDVVCLSALSAMEGSRKGLFVRTQAGAQPGPAMANSVGARACAQFWANLATFCGYNLAPKAWREAVPNTHPFLYFDTSTEKWKLNRRSVSE